VTPQAAAGGPIGLVRDGDTIEIDIPARTLNVKLTEAEFEERRKQQPAPPERALSGWLKRYQRQVTSANTGAVLQ
jgi:dihydroxy-acid dehydratase